MPSCFLPKSCTIQHGAGVGDSRKRGLGKEEMDGMNGVEGFGLYLLLWECIARRMENVELDVGYCSWCIGERY